MSRMLGRPSLGSILVRRGVITPAELRAGLEHQARLGCRLGEALVRLEYCSDADLARAIAEQLEIPFLDLREEPPDPAVAGTIPREIALEYGAVPVRIEGDRLLVAVRDPFDITIDEAVKTAAGTGIVIGLAPEGQIRELLQLHCPAEFSFDPGQARHGTVHELDLDSEDAPPLARILGNVEQAQASMVVNAIISDAHHRRASDIHVQPGDNLVRVRLRVDGAMQPAASLPLKLLPSIVSRIKIVCGMDIAESRRPQDGGCRVRVHGDLIELRASVLPSIYGESVVLRILDAAGGAESLDSLGVSQDMLRTIHALLAARSGLIIVTGPTGSGKTTTLYAALAHLHREEVNIITVEDPVELKLPGITQVQVDDRAGRGFAQTLRAMLRQDPDILMVGEIRDAETADIACRAALTGHLVLTTLHSRHAIGTVARLTDMGIPAHLLSAALNGIVAQRLVKRNCPHCAEPYDPSPRLLRVFETRFGSLAGVQFRKGAGCAHCHYRGIRGRLGVYEVLPVDEAVRSRISQGPHHGQLQSYRLGEDFQGLEWDCFTKAAAGLIPPEEVLELGMTAAMSFAEQEGRPEAREQRVPLAVA